MKSEEWLDGRELAKAGFLALLRATGHLRALKIFPMLTGNGFSDAQWKCYAQFLGVASGDLLSRARFAHQPGHFDAASRFPNDDLFADAGTGIADRGQESSKVHISIKEMEQLLPQFSDRLLIVFQSKPNHDFENISGIKCPKGQVFRTAIKHKLDVLKSLSLHCFAYYDASVNFIVISRSGDRIESLYAALKDALLVPTHRLIKPTGD